MINLLITIGVKEVFIGIGILLVGLIIILLIKAACFKDKTNYRVNAKEVETPKDDIVYKLGELIKIPTVSHEDESLVDFSQYDRYLEKVKELYPTVFKHCEFEYTKDRVFKFKLKGHSSEKPTVLMAHYDVVPVTEGWKHDPFLGEVVDGHLFGRGTLDTKNTMACALSALEKELEKGYVPKNDLYLTFGSNEETCGNAQYNMVQEFERQGIKPYLVFDEGGGVLSNAFPGVSKDIAFLGMVEKGMVNFILSYDDNGGHSSSPKKNGPAIRLAKALIRLEKHPMKPKLTRTVKETLRVMGKNAIFPLKIVFGNMWLFKGLVTKLLPVLGSDTRALVSTTFAFTILNGGNQGNVIPNHVEANVNARIAPFNSIDEVEEHIRKVIKDDKIKITRGYQYQNTKECDYEHPGYSLIKEVTIETYPDTLVAPFVMIGGTDAKHYSQISDCVIRFSPMKVTNEDRKGIHGLNERIKVESLEKCLEFYQRLLTKI
jgi:carboxypeptidase PM20D1